MKKALCLLLTVIMTAAMLSTAAFYTFADDWTYTFRNGVLTVTGRGDVGGGSSSLEDYPWNGFRSSILEVVVGDGITSVGKNAFSSCKDLYKVTYGKDVAALGMDAMAYCGSLEEVIFGRPILEIGQGTVYGSGNLKKVTVTGQSRAEFLTVANVRPYNDGYASAQFTVVSGVDHPDTIECTLVPLYGMIENYPQSNGRATPDSRTCFIVGGMDPQSCVYARNGYYKMSVTVTDETDGITYYIDEYAFDDPEAEVYGSGDFLRLAASDYGIDVLAGHAYTLQIVITEGDFTVAIGSSAVGAFDRSTCQSFLSEGQIIPEKAPHESVVSGQYLFADLDADGESNVSDVTALLNLLGGILPDGLPGDPDLSFDERTDIADVTALLNILSGIETFRFSLIPGENAYKVIGIGNMSGKKMTVPGTCNGLPVVSVGHNVFRNNEKLEKVTLPESVTEISSAAFLGCTALERINYGGGARRWMATGAAVASDCIVSVKDIPGEFDEQPDPFDGIDLTGAARISDYGMYDGGLRVKSTGELLFSPDLSELRSEISGGRAYDEYTVYLRFTDLSDGCVYPSVELTPVKSRGSFVDLYLVGNEGHCGFCPTAGRQYRVELVTVDNTAQSTLCYGTYTATAAAGYANSDFYDPTAPGSSNSIPENVRPDGKYLLRYAAATNGSLIGDKKQLVEEGGDAATVTAVPDAGFRFVGWTDGYPTAERSDLAVEDDVKVTAYFVPNVDFTGIPNMFIVTGTGSPVVTKDYVGTTVIVEGTPDGANDIISTAQMKGRGNSSWNGGASQSEYDSKNSYKLKFDEKVKLLGMGDKKNKDWVLNSNKFDLSGLRNWTVWDLAEKMGTIPYVVESSWVQLYVNGEYRGMYTVCEQVEAAGGRADVDDSLPDPDKGYLIEFDFRGNEDVDPYFYVTGYADLESGIGLHSAVEFVIKSDINGDEDIEFIKNYVQNCHDAIMSGDRTAIGELVDLDSLIDMYILEELSKDCDMGRASFFVQKDVGGKLFFTAPWDFDFGFGTYGPATNTGGLVSQNGEACVWFSSLVTREWFREAVTDRMEALSGAFAETLTDLAAKGEELTEAADKNAIFWNMYGRSFHGYVSSQVSRNLNSYAEHIGFLADWTSERWNVLYNILCNY